MGALSVAAVGIGATFISFQKAAWVIFGMIYVIVGIVYLAGKSQSLKVSLGPALSRFATLEYPAALGVVFEFNSPACAGPLIAVLLGLATARGSAGVPLVPGFISMALFGLALSLPIAPAVFFERARTVLN